MFLDLNSKGLHQSSEKKKKVVEFCFPWTKREIRQFHVVAVQRGRRNVLKSVMHVQSSCFACLNLLIFFPFSLPSPSPSSLCKLPIECFHMTSRRPYWCPKTMKRRPCWCPKPILWELYSCLMQMRFFSNKFA